MRKYMLKNIRKTTQHKYKHQITPSNKQKNRNPKYGTRIPRWMPTFLSAQTGAASELGVAFLYVKNGFVGKILTQ